LTTSLSGEDAKCAFLPGLTDGILSPLMLPFVDKLFARTCAGDSRLADLTSCLSSTKAAGAGARSFGDVRLGFDLGNGEGEMSRPPGLVLPLFHGLL
jgi:hypothetical protein